MPAGPAPQGCPTIEVLNGEGTAPVVLMVWHIRAIYRAKVRNQDGTRIEFSNGDIFESAEQVENVLSLFNVAVNGPVRGYVP